MLRNVICIRVIAILTLIRQLCKLILHEAKTELHEFQENRRTFCMVTMRKMPCLQEHLTNVETTRTPVFECPVTNWRFSYAR